MEKPIIENMLILHKVVLGKTMMGERKTVISYCSWYLLKDPLNFHFITNH